MELNEVQEKMKQFSHDTIAKETGLNRMTVRAIAYTTKFSYGSFLKVIQFLKQKEVNNGKM